MIEVKNSLKRLAVIYLLLAINTLWDADIIPGRFPFEHLSSLYLFTLSACLFVHYYRRVTQHRGMRGLMLALAGMEMLLILLRGIKYSIFGDVFFIGRYCWYLYYIPVLFIPVLLFYIALFIYAKDVRQAERKWAWVAVVTVILILFVLTNDLHQMVFRFNPGFENWDGDYSYGGLFTVITAWEYVFYVVAIAVLLIKCRILKVRNHAWVILVPFLIGLTTLVLLLTNTMPQINGATPIEFPETLAFMVAGVLECCMQIGIIPTNENYRSLMKETSAPVQITDLAGNVIYKSEAAKELTKEQFSAPDGARIREHTILRRMDVPGGYGFFENDVTELDELNGKLSEAGKALSEEAELVRLQNELKEEQAKIEQRALVYDTIAKRTQNQSLAISRISEEALRTEDPDVKDRCRKHIAMLGAYIKRYANLMLLSEVSKTVSVNELGLSVTEVLRYLNRCGIPGELMNTAQGSISTEEALAVFEAFETLLENNLSDLTGAFVNLDTEGGRLIFQLTLENMRVEIPVSVTEKLMTCGIQSASEYEDNVGYISFVFPKGGEAA